MQPITQGLCRLRARNSSRITVKLSSRAMCYDTAETVGYSEWRVCVKRYTFTHDSFLPTIVPERSSTAAGPHDGRPRENTL